MAGPRLTRRHPRDPNLSPRNCDLFSSWTSFASSTIRTLLFHHQSHLRGLCNFNLAVHPNANGSFHSNVQSFAFSSFRIHVSRTFSNNIPLRASNSTLLHPSTIHEKFQDVSAKRMSPVPVSGNRRIKFRNNRYRYRYTDGENAKQTERENPASRTRGATTV